MQNYHKWHLFSMLVWEFFEGQTKNMQITFSSVKYSKTKNLIGNFYMKLSSIRNPTLSDKHTPSLEKVSTTFERKKVESWGIFSMEFILLLKVPKWPSNNEDSMNYRDSLDVNGVSGNFHWEYFPSEKFPSVNFHSVNFHYIHYWI